MAKQEITCDDILRELKAGQYRPIYYLMGEEPYYIDLISDYITDNVLNETEKEFNLTVVYGADVDVATIINAAKRYPMMSEHQVVVVKEAQNIRNIDELSYYLQKPLLSTILVICHKHGVLDKRKKLAAEIEKSGILFESRKVKELHPKYSPFDCDRLHKGEPIGVEAVLQKAFNNTFKFNMEMSTCDLSLCQHVTKAVMRKIEKYFKEHPDDEIKFETSQLPVPPNVTAIHLNIDDAQRDHISSLLNIELPNLTYPKVKEILSDNGLTEVLCGAENTLLFLYGYSWEQNENFDMIYSKYDFKRK